VIAAEGRAAKFARRMFEIYEDDIESRVGHVQKTPPTIELRVFEPRIAPEEVWRSPTAQSWSKRSLSITSRSRRLSPTGSLRRTESS